MCRAPASSPPNRWAERPKRGRNVPALCRWQARPEDRLTRALCGPDVEGVFASWTEVTDLTEGDTFASSGACVSSQTVLLPFPPSSLTFAMARWGWQMGTVLCGHDL